MADDENQEITETKPKASEGGVLDLNSALQQLLKKSAAKEDGLARGLREAVKALDRKVVRVGSEGGRETATTHSRTRAYGQRRC